MKLGKLSLGLVTIALGVASAASSSYRITIPADTWAGDTQLKAGDYKVTVEGNQATFKHGKREHVQVPASMEKNTNKSPETTLETSGTKLQAIDIGGSTMKIVIKGGKSSTAATQ